MSVNNLAVLLNAREKELSAIYENVPGILFYIAIEPGGEFRFLSVSRDFLIATGLTREQIVGSLVRDVIPPPSWDMVLNYYREAILSHQTVRWEEESVYPAGRKYGEVAVTPLYDAGGVATHLIGIVHDITGRKRLEESLRENEERQAFLLGLSDAFRSAADTGAMQALACQKLGEHLRVNRVAYADIEGDEFATRESWVNDVSPRIRRGPVTVFGKTRVEAFRRGETISSDDVIADPRFTDTEQELFRENEIRAFVSVGLTKSGRWVGTFGVHSRTPRVWTNVEIGLIQEVAERSRSAAEHARADEALREREQRLRLALEASGAGSWMRDHRTGRAHWDRRFREIYGFTAEEPASFESWLSRVHEKDHQQQVELWDQILHSRTHDTFDSTFRIVRPDGTVLWIQSLGQAHRDAEGRLIWLSGLELDVTERRRTEEALRSTEARLRVFLENSPTIAWLKDEDGRHVFHSPRYEEQFGVLRGDWQGKTDFDLWPKEVAEQFQQNDRAVLAANQPVEVLESKPGPDGTISWWLNKKFWFRDESGYRYIGGIGLDITDRKRIEEALRQSEERFRLAAEATGLGTFDYDASRRRRSFSPEVWGILGLPSRGEPSDIDVMQFIHPDDEEAFKRMRIESLDPSGPGHHDAVFRIVRPEGQVRWIRAVSRTFFQGEGELRHAVRVVGTLLDVTDGVRLRQHLELALQRTDSELRTIVKAAPIGIVTMDHEGRVTTWNDAAERIFGYRVDEVLGRMDLTVPQNAFGGFRQSLVSALEGATVQTKGQRVRKDRSVIHVSLVHAPLHDEHGAARGVITLVEDITEKKNTESTLARVRSALAEVQVEEARRIARDLHDDIGQRLALLSFEIDRMVSRPPHSREELVASFRSFRQKIIDVCDGLREISHRMHPSVLEHLGLPAALQYLCDDFSQREEIPVNFDSDELTNDIPLSISSCLYRISQEALRNISKHAKASYTEVKLAMVEGALQLCIIDSGAGFDTSAVKFGLGLYSMRERAELVNGAFSITSQPGSGTRIVVSVPLHELLSTPSLADGDNTLRTNEGAEVQTKKCRLLIGDDHTLFAAGVAKLLEDTCEVVATVGDGLALVQAAEQLNPDLILVDISMPLMNGFDAARQIKKSVPGTKLLFLTTHADAVYADEAFKSGANGYLVKQAALSELPKAITAVLEGDTYRSAAITSRARGSA
jgi:PAS domain S-box-containing protein